MAVDPKHEPRLRIGLAVGRGTGPELAAVFRQVLERMACHVNVQVEITQSPRIYQSYNSLLTLPDAGGIITQKSREDADHYQDFLKSQAAQGAAAVFRTSFSAQALYDVRERLESVKVEHFKSASKELLLVRDQAQGFYGGLSLYDASSKIISRTCTFQEGIMSRIVDFALARARTVWPGLFLDSVTLVYKHHLFDGIFDTWAKRWSTHYGIPIKFVQPDTTNRNILAFGFPERSLIITGNEYGDIMQAFLLQIFGGEAQETSCAENVYLKPGLRNLSEFQTIHGSADDIAEKNLVNPTATVRIATTILDNHRGRTNLNNALSQVLELMRRKRMLTPDQGGHLQTQPFLDRLLDTLENILIEGCVSSSAGSGIVERTLNGACNRLVADTLTAGRGPPGPGRQKLLIVMDWQNDFVGKSSIVGSNYNGDSSILEEIGRNIDGVIKNFRSQNAEVIFVRFLGDKRFQLPNWRARDRKLDRTTRCYEDTPGADIAAPLVVETRDHVFNKLGHYDAFMNREFERHLLERHLHHLFFVGIFADVCIDATLRTAFQRGYFGTIIEDCIATLHLSKDQYCQFAYSVYGTEIVKTEEFFHDTSSSSRPQPVSKI